MEHFTQQQAQRLARVPVAHLATASRDAVPHVVPVCFALDCEAPGQPIYTVLDRKPKRAPLRRLRRVRNLLENPPATLLADHYEPDWSKLWYILVAGVAGLLTVEEAGSVGQERLRAIGLLRGKYPQYRDMDIDRNPVIRITPARVTAWAGAPGSAGGTGPGRFRG